MFYIKRCTLLSCALLSMYLVGCATNIPFIGKDKNRESLSSKKEQEELAALAAVQSGADGDSTNFVLIPSPYVEKSSAIPSGARNDFTSALALMKEERWVEAETILLGMREQYSKLSGVDTNLGIVYQRTNKFDESEKALISALEKNALNFDAYTVLGNVLREQGKFTQAEEVYLKALSYWPHHPASRRNLGILYDLYMGSWPQALEQFKVSQQIAGGEDRELKGWIIDLERRIGEKAPIDRTLEVDSSVEQSVNEEEVQP